MGIPPFLTKVAMLTEFCAPICLVLGLFTRVAALGVMIMMIVAMTKHLKNGYFANWSGKKAGEGIEFHVLYAGAALALLLTGPGPWSIDAWFMNIVHASSADGHVPSGSIGHTFLFSTPPHSGTHKGEAAHLREALPFLPSIPARS